MGKYFYSTKRGFLSLYIFVRVFNDLARERERERERCLLYFNNCHYQSLLILTELFQHNLINVSYLTACYLYQVMMTLHFLNDVVNDAESTQTSKITS